jgi:hypothetical protein
MKKISIIILFFIGISITRSSAQENSADMVFTNGKIYTVDNKNPFVEAVAIKDGKFMEVGATRVI